MSTLNPHESPEMPGWLKVLVWLGVFLSPTEFILLLMIMDMRHVPAPADVVVVSLFILIPVAALLACEIMVWRSKIATGWRGAGLVLTPLAMLLQCGFWFVLIVSAITAAIAPV